MLTSPPPPCLDSKQTYGEPQVSNLLRDYVQTLGLVFGESRRAGLAWTTGPSIMRRPITGGLPTQGACLEAKDQQRLRPVELLGLCFGESVLICVQDG